MRDLIDRSELLKRIKSEYCGNCNSDNCAKCRYCEYEVMIEIIEEQPTVNNEIADELERLSAERDAAVEKLKFWANCGECKHRESNINKGVCRKCVFNSKWEWRGGPHD